MSSAELYSAIGWEEQIPIRNGPDTTPAQAMEHANGIYFQTYELPILT